jgi:multicomponent Na+:H+ antiporter subunit B
MNNTRILRAMSKFIYPYVILYGFYVTIHGYITPGGGFQGGVIVATGVLLMAFFTETNFNLTKLNKFEKLIFVGLISFSMISYFTKGYPFKNFLSSSKEIFLIVMNFAIGFKVTLGLINILESFFEEGERLD